MAPRTSKHLFIVLIYGIDVYSVSSPASTSSGVSSFEGVYVAQYLLADNVQDRLCNAHLSSNTTLQKDAKDGVECLCVRQWVARHVVHRLYRVFALFLGFGFPLAGAQNSPTLEHHHVIQ